MTARRSVVAEQIADWQARCVSIQDAALSMGHLPPYDWTGVAAIVEREWARAKIKVEKCKTRSKG